MSIDTKKFALKHTLQKLLDALEHDRIAGIEIEALLLSPQEYICEKYENKKLKKQFEEETIVYLHKFEQAIQNGSRMPEISMGPDGEFRLREQ